MHLAVTSGRAAAGVGRLHLALASFAVALGMLAVGLGIFTFYMFYNDSTFAFRADGPMFDAHTLDCICLETEGTECTNYHDAPVPSNGGRNLRELCRAAPL